MTPEDLLAFEEEIAADFAAGLIHSPVHLGGGNELQLIEIFRDIQPDDWVFVGWRAHFHALLKGAPRDELKAAILAGHSVSLCFPRQKILCSGIVGGIAPIALGVAWSLKRRNDDGLGPQTFAHVFLGDMSAESGIVHECMKYAEGHNLPIRWIVEDNGLSVCTDTRKSWGEWEDMSGMPRVVRYKYKLTRSHVGVGAWVRF